MNDINRIKRIHEAVIELKKVANQQNDDNPINESIRQLAEKLDTLLKDLVGTFLDFREISDSLYDGMYISDGSGRTLFINEAYTRITGIEKEQVIGRTVEEISREGKLYKGAVTTEVLKKKERISSIGKSLVNNKEHLVTGTPIFDDSGNVRLVVINNRDISELKELESKMMKMQTNQILANEEIKFLRKQLSSKAITSIDKSMVSIMELIDTIAPTDVTVLITGESGTGKEVIADEIYFRSRRNQKPFIKINCAAIPAELLESELFGYEKGAFTDAKKSGKIGMFELANQGTILLDEIGDMPIKLQTKLLRVLQDKEIVRLGGEAPIKLDIRLIASTNKDLQTEMLEGRFRDDLFYRLNVVPIHIRPLRERIDDIESLTEEFIDKYNKKYGKMVKLETTSYEILKEYKWPGNIRELENLIERMVVINRDGVIKHDNILNILYADEAYKNGPKTDMMLKNAVENLEREIIMAAINNYKSVNKAAKKLGLSQPALWKKCKKLDIKTE
ncbi:MAG: sigma 54-interacting transcriptional regulator [Eubacteriales bacterium]|nr:sigma 54-interacting transcriptional regulator [Eubacteriales bacterium]